MRNQVLVEQFGQAGQGNFPGTAGLAEKPAGKGKKATEDIAVRPEQGRSAAEITAVVDQIPVASHALEFLHLGKGYEGVLQQFIGWSAAVDHAVLSIVPVDGRARELFQDAKLDFTLAPAHELV